MEIEGRFKSQQQVFDKKAIRIINSYSKIKNKLLNLLASYGVEAIKLQDQQAEIGLCEVVDIVADTEQPSGKILETMKTGYRLNNKILRPAQVITAK